LFVFLFRNITLIFDGGGIKELLQGSMAASGDGGRKDLILVSYERIDVALSLIGLFSFVFWELFDKNMSYEMKNIFNFSF
jgi:hypothetical protein